MAATIISMNDIETTTRGGDRHPIPSPSPLYMNRFRSRGWFCITLLLSVFLFVFLYDTEPWSSSSSSSGESLLLRHFPGSGDKSGDAASTTLTTSKRTADGKPEAIIPPADTNTNTNTNANANANADSNNNNDDNEDAELAALRHKLRPHPLYLDSNNGTMALVAQQFLHLHHMKTGGTSMDGLIRCGMGRLLQRPQPVVAAAPLSPQPQPALDLRYANIHECGYAAYQSCVSGQNPSCSDRIQKAGILSYCAPLRDLQTPAFGWNVSTTTTTTTSTNTALSSSFSSKSSSPPPPPRAAVTVLRHPVGRVWSMFRFQTKNCYSCNTLLDLYRDIDAGNSTLSPTCKMQLLNHQTRNLLAEPNVDYPDTAEQAQAAIRNMKEFFTMIGLTDDMTATAQMVQMVFPWLAEDLEWEKAVQVYHPSLSDGSNAASAPPPVSAHSSTTTKCVMGHQNASPQNNHCLDHGTKHWNLPDTPDEETSAAILAHNEIDIIVYEAATILFAQQKKALGL